jgi:hypothetical protein
MYPHSSVKARRRNVTFRSHDAVIVISETSRLLQPSSVPDKMRFADLVIAWCSSFRRSAPRASLFCWAASPHANM